MQHVHERGGDALLARFTLELAYQLGLIVVAEAIEDTAYLVEAYRSAVRCPRGGLAAPRSRSEGKLRRDAPAERTADGLRMTGA